MIRNIIKTIIICIINFTCWFIFSTNTEPFYLYSGAASTLIVAFLAFRLQIMQSNNWHHYFNYRILSYGLWLVKEIITSTIDVAIRIWQVKPDLSPEYFWIPSHQKNDIGRTIYSNSITLTPGTISIVVDDEKYYVHALTHDSKKSLEVRHMDSLVCNLSKYNNIKDED